MQSRSVRSIAAASLVLWLAQSGVSFAQTPDPAAQAPIVVTARSQEQAQSFVEQVAAAPAAADRLARWDSSVCVSVAGAPQRQGQFIADQIARRAGAVGLTPGAPGCRANIAVIVTADADAAAHRMFEQDRAIFGSQQSAATTMGQAALDAFLASDQPVRWWHVSETVSADGILLNGDASSGGISNAPVARSLGSRLRSDIRQDLSRAIIIVDAHSVGGVQLSALADYIAMVALAQLNPEADTGAYPSILNVFGSDRSGLTAMTDWDLAYLRGLYAATRNAANVQQQQREIARRMLESDGVLGS